MHGPLISRIDFDPFRGAPSFSLANRLLRLSWALAWFAFASWTPPNMHRWRIFLLRCFGASIHPSAHVYGSTRIWYPPNLRMSSHACLGPKVNCYNMAPIFLEEKAVVSQGATLCAGTHDVDSIVFQLVVKPIVIGKASWVASEAFVGPGVSVGGGAVVGARCVLFRNAEENGIYVGNPGRLVRFRNLRGNGM